MNDNLELRRVRPSDEDLLLLWANDPEVRYQAISQKVISINEHKKWFSQRLNDPNTRMWIVENNSIPAGQIRWDLNGKEAILDYSISKDYRGRGLGVGLLKRSIKELNKIWTGVLLIAEVKEKNIASTKAITGAGFEEDNPNKPGYLRFKFKL